MSRGRLPVESGQFELDGDTLATQKGIAKRADTAWMGKGA